MINNIRGTTSIAIPSGMQQHPSGAPAFALQRLHMSEFAGYDPNSRLASAASDGGEGTGWSISLTGGLAGLTDPFDGAYWIGSISSIFGTKLADTDLMWSLQVQAIERTSPGLSTDYNIYAGVCNEAVDSGTIDAVLAAIRYGAARNAVSSAVTNGTVSNQTSSAGGIRGWIDCFHKHGLANGRLMHISACFVDAALVPVTTSIGTGAFGVTNFGDAEPYLVIAAERSAATAGTATGAYDFYAGLGISWRAAT